MTFTILSKRSAVAGHAPTTSQLQLGELAVNTNDGLLYFVQSNSTTNANTMVCLGSVPQTANALSNPNSTIAVSGSGLGTSFIRASNATYFDVTGTLQTAAPNVSRLNYPTVSNVVTNLIRNSSMVGAVAGTPGTLPTDWTNTVPSGLTETIVDSGVINGLPYIDISYTGTPTVTGTINIVFDKVAASFGQQFTTSAYFQVISGSISNVATPSFILVELNSSSGFLTQNSSTSTAITNTSLQRYSATYTTSNASCAYFETGLYIYITNGTPVSFELRIAAPQLELSPFANAWVPTSGSVASAGGVPSGITNWIRNSSAVGALLGNIIVDLPTYWQVLASSGLSWSIVNTGYESGIPFVDFQFTGTTSAINGNFSIQFDNQNYTPAAVGQIWTVSVYARVVANSTPVYPYLYINEYAANNTFLTNGNNTAAITTAALVSQRYSYTRTVANSLTNNVVGVLYWYLPSSGTTVNLTVRIGAPQLEMGTIANPWVPTSGTIATVGGNPLGYLFENSATNYLTNPNMVGVVPGTPYGTLPTNWSVIEGYGNTYNILDSGTENGIPYFDIQFNGNATASYGLIFAWNSPSGSTTSVPAAYGQTWTGSIYTKIISGNLANSSAQNEIVVQVLEYYANGAYTLNSASNAYVISTTNVPLASCRLSATRTLSTTNVAYVGFYCYFVPPVGSNAAVTFRVGSMQLEQGSYPTSLILPPAGTTGITTRAADITYNQAGTNFVRNSNATYFDVNGYLQTAAPNVERPLYVSGAQTGYIIENSATNLIRNPWCAGATTGLIGSGGAFPTYWAVVYAVPTNLGFTVVGTGIDSGIPYMDFSIVGTPSATMLGYFMIDTGTVSGVTTLTHSAYFKLTNGSMSNVTNFGLQTNALTSGSADVVKDSYITPTGAGLSTQRLSGTIITSSTDTAAQLFVVYNVTSGQYVNATIRVGGPQLEVGGTATSLILPPPGYFAAWTRAADNIVGGGNTVVNLALANTGVTAGTYSSVTVNSQGLVTAGSNPYFQAVTYNNDGITWSAQTLPANLSWNGVAYGNGVFVAVAGNSNISAVSTNGVTWSQNLMPFGNWISITFGNGIFVAIPYNYTNFAAYSPDGINWTQSTLPVVAAYHSITFGNGVFVAVAGNGSNVAVTSPDGINWTQYALPSTQGWYSVTYGNNTFVTIAATANASSTTPTNISAYSTNNGVTWTQGTLPFTAIWEGVAYGNGVFVAVADGTSVGNATTYAAYSTTGVTWTQSTMSANSYWQSLTYGNGLFTTVGYGSSVASTSPDGVNWTTRTMPSASGWSGLAVGNAPSSSNGIIVAISQSTAAAISNSCSIAAYPYVSLTGGTITGNLTVPTLIVNNTTTLNGYLTTTGSFTVTVANASTNFNINANTTGGSSGSAIIAFESNAATSRTINLQSNGVNRWTMGMDTSAETGNSVGGNYVITAYADDGVTSVTAMTGTRYNNTINIPSLHATNLTATNLILTNTSIALVGSVTGAGTFTNNTVSITTSLPNSGVTAGTYNQYVINSQGIITSGTYITPQRTTGGITLYVSPSGSDSNNGLTSGSAFATLQKAWNTLISSYDDQGSSLTIQCANGTYTSPLVCAGIQMVALGGVTIQGNTASPNSCVISTTSNTAISLTGGASITLQGFYLTTTGSGSYDAINLNQASNLSLNSINFGPATGSHIHATNGSGVSIYGSGYTISGGGYAHLYASSCSYVQYGSNQSALVLSGTPSFSRAFVAADYCSCINTLITGYTGNTTSSQYSATFNSTILQYAGGGNLLPGYSSNSSVSTGSIKL